MFDPKAKGFFPVFFEKYYSLLLKDCPPLDSSSLEARLRIVWKNISPEKPFKNVSPLYGEKSTKKSAKIRNQGNAFFYDGDLSSALLHYSLAMFSAPSGSTDMALALGNRSAILQKLNRFSEALVDVYYTLDSGAYPREKLFKLYEREAEIYESLLKSDPGDSEEEYKTKLVAAVDSAIEHVQFSSLNKEKQEIFKEGLNKKLHVKPCSNERPLKSPELPSASNIGDEFHPALEMKYEPGKGRYVVASREISPCETIFLESPGSFALHQRNYGSYCQVCFKSISKGTVYPCEKCTWVSFCCLRCKEEGMSFHVYECAINKWFLTSGLNIYPMLVLRALSQLGPERLENIQGTIFEKRDESLKPVCDTKEDNFISIFQLNCHENHMTQEDWGLRALIALFMTYSLKVSGFLDGSDMSTFNDNDFYIGAIILRLLNNCPSNCHDISEYQTPVKGEFTPATNVCSLGAGIYPLLAMCNHSCDPSFMRCNIGNKVWCVSNKTIKKGEEVFENYGIIYTTKSTDERRLILKKHYKFDCLCMACNESWPDTITFKQRVKSIPLDRFDQIYCGKCSKVLIRKENRSSVIACPACLHQNDLGTLELKQLISLAEEVELAFTKGKWTEGVGLFKKADALLQGKGLRMPVYDFIEMQISLWRGMWVEKGSLRYVKML